MKRRAALAVGSGALTLLAVACVDLFHDTDFPTLCTTNPADPACGGDAGIDVVLADVRDQNAPPADIDFCSLPSLAAREAAVRSCALLGACEQPLGEASFGACVVRAQLAFDCRVNPALRPRGEAAAFWQCMYRAKTCTDIHTCSFGREQSQPCDVVSTGKYIQCNSFGTADRVRLDCPAPGGPAATSTEPCLLQGRRCAAPDPSTASCTGALGYASCATTGCQGSAAVACETVGSLSRDRGLDCALAGGGRCVDEGAGPSCTAAEGAPACDAGASAPFCEATQRAVVSCVDGKEIRIDCRALGLACDDSSPVPPYEPDQACVRRGAIEVCTGPDACEGNTMVSCARGQRYEADCTRLGLGACRVLPSGRAACTAP